MKPAPAQSKNIALAILHKPHLLGLAVVQANCKRRVIRRRVIAEMFEAAKIKHY